MSEVKLKPCPFCGSENIMLDKTKEDTLHLAVCRNCVAEVSGFTRDGAIRALNTRKPMDNIVEQLKKKREQCFDSSSEIEKTGNIMIADRYFYKGMGFVNAIRIIAEGGVED